MPADLEPFAALWVSALELLIQDARQAARRGRQAGPDAIEALADLMNCGPIVRRLCRPINVDPEMIARAVQIELRLCEAA